ncbi:MAG: folylpolyglutamate synthase/dihydrofolate synthase family protein [Spiribacter sp.]|nr:folylpolyglutamate synthase/dihydrofolate synthase family protein [Spiribacter sp.]MDR9489006.1 folylpolyglutamate synthase/dihydrofolate synthase family protein [Spiribacter sp.]
MSESSLEQWLDHLETVHPSRIDLGLGRVTAVADRMGLRDTKARVMIVAGTNGKGSTVACLEAMFEAAGQRPGSYTSPHLLRFNERIRVNQAPMADALILRAFAAIESARAEITLTYFEFATLAAAWCFREQGADPWILEVGLGGRLDATNCFDADLAIVTAIGLDHMEWLGNTREAIAGEKMGVARPGCPIICSDSAPPQHIAERAAELKSPLWQFGHHFAAQVSEEHWQWASANQHYSHLPRPDWIADAAIANAAGAVMAVSGAHSDLYLDESAVRSGLAQARLVGRQQMIVDGTKRWMFDVGHNPAAITLLVERLARERCDGKIRLAFGLMQRKPLQELIEKLTKLVDEWFILDLNESSMHSPQSIRDALVQVGAFIVGEGDAATAKKVFNARAKAMDLSVAVGSFKVVEAFMRVDADACNRLGTG